MTDVDNLELTIEVTSYCPHSCNFCSSNCGPNGQHLDYETIERFLNHYQEVQRINISGGEPLAHPYFWRILEAAKAKSSDVRVYTNALEHIHYNAHVIPEVEVSAHVCLVPGERVYIPQKAHNVRLLQLIPQGRAAEIVPINCTLSGHDCDHCNHALLRCDGRVAKAPCAKDTILEV